MQAQIRTLEQQVSSATIWRLFSPEDSRLVGVRYTQHAAESNQDIRETRWRLCCRHAVPPSMPAESTVYRWLKSSAKADRLRQALQQVDLQNEFREFLREKFARVRA
jgi:hypothetical protein